MSFNAISFRLGKRIICSLKTGYVKLAGKISGGVEYWRGGVMGEDGRGFGGEGGREVAAVHGGAYRLPGYAEGGGGGGAAVASDKSGDGVVVHGVSKARRRVVPYASSSDGCQILVALVWQCCDGRPYKGQSVFSMTLGKGINPCTR